MSKDCATSLYHQGLAMPTSSLMVLVERRINFWFLWFGALVCIWVLLFEWNNDTLVVHPASSMALCDPAGSVALYDLAGSLALCELAGSLALCDLAGSLALCDLARPLDWKLMFWDVDNLSWKGTNSKASPGWIFSKDCFSLVLYQYSIYIAYLANTHTQTKNMFLVGLWRAPFAAQQRLKLSMF